jgi:uncharacterized repeat protein (TIGR02543 family)
MMSLLFACEVRAATYYVDKATGSDSRAGTSVSTAWATIGKANATVKAGDTVYVRAGTYDEIIEPYQSGSSGAPITYMNYSGETVTLRGEAGQPYIVTIGAGVHSSWNAKSYIVVDGFTIRHINPKGVSSRPILVFINGGNSSYNVIRNCTIQCQGSAVWQGFIEDAVEVYAAKYTTIENNHISGYPRLGVYVNGIAQYTTIRGNDIRDCVDSCIDLSSSKGTMQYTLIENNVIDHSLCEDGVQFENNYDLPSGTVDSNSNRGVVIRNNIICNNGENGVDLKGAAYVIIEDNIFYGCKGDNDGGLNPSVGDIRYPGAFTIMHGTGPSSSYVTIRRNVLYDGPGGITPENYFKIYNNTIVYNNRDYSGTNSSWGTGGGTNKPTFIGIDAWLGVQGVGIKNNIIGGHNAAEVAIIRGATALDIDNNLYFNDNGALLVDFRGMSNWSWVSFSQWPSFLTSQGVQGDDSHSRQAAPLFVNVPADLTGTPDHFDFHLQSGSPAIDHGGFLTTTTSAGQGTSIPVKDAGYFFDGYGIVDSDTIQLQGQSVTARIVSINSNTLVVDKSLTWSSGQGVSLAYQGSMPDAGAYEYGGGSTTTYTLTISAPNGTVTKTPDKTGYNSGDTVTLQATPSTGYTFSGWSGNLTGTTNPATLVMNANKSVTANFTAVPASYTLTIGAANGTVTKTPNQTSYTSGQTVTLQATPNTGYTFSGWTGDLTGSTNPATLVMNANKSVTATFTAATYTLTIGATNGTVTKTPNQTSYTSGQTVTLQATPSTGYTFTGWTGDLTGSTTPATLVMNANKSVTASFTAAKPSVYYVDRGAGNDNNDGKSPATAWQSISKVNSYTGFVPGDQILLHRGHVWREQLIVSTSGTADKPIVIGTYDTGNRPQLKGSAWFTIWTSAGTNRWKASLSTQPNQVFFNGVRGTMKTSQAALTGAQQWYWASGVLYVYATSSPSVTTPVIEASVRPSLRTSGLIQIQDRSYVTVQDIEVTQSYSAGICIASSGQGILIKGCEADNSLDGGIVATSDKVALSNVTIDSCLVHNNNGGIKEGALGVATYHEGLTMEGVNGFAVRGCQIYSNYALGVSLKHGATNGVVENCQVNSNGLLNFYHDGASKIQIRYNKIYNCASDAGIKFGLGTSAYNNDTIQVYYNLFWGNANGISFTANSGVTSQTRNISIYNNTFYNSPAAIRWNSTATGHYSGANSIKDNILWAQVTTNIGIRDETTGKQGIAQTTVAYNAFQKNAPTDTIGTNARVVADPYFANPSAYDFHLKSGSPCIDAGTNVGLTRDFEGDLVPQGSGPDMGVYEYGTLRATTTSEPTMLASATAASAPVANDAKDSAASTPAMANASLSDTMAVKTATAASPTSGSAGIAPSAGTSQSADAISATDQLPPVLSGCSPASDSIQVSPNTLVVLQVRDEGKGVDAASVSIRVDGHLVYTGDVDSLRTAYGICYRSGTKAQYTYAYQQQGGFGYSRQVAVTVNARDLAGNGMPEQTYSFDTEMYSFGVNRSVSTDQTGLSQGGPATVDDGRGNIWVVWHAGNPGSRHIYAAHFRPDVDSYSGTVQLSHSTGDHCHPAIVIDRAGTLYAVWQENANGAWDVCVSTSVDGQTWSTPRPIVATTSVQTGPAVNRVNPVVAAGRQSSGLVAVAWQEDRAGNQDIYVAVSANRLQTATVSRVTSDPAAQTDPVIAVDSQDTIFVLWTDARNGSTDIYGAASDNGPWTNVPVVNGGSNQSHPALAVGTTGRTLYVAWVDDKAGNPDVFYATSAGLPTSPLTGTSIIDDTSGADQQAPVLGVAAKADGTDRVFVCWEDARNIAYGGNVDLYFADVSPGSLRTNVLVDNGGTSGSQHKATLSTDRLGYPYVVWVGDLGKTRQLYYYSGATYVNPAPLVEGRIIASAGGVIGTPPEKIKTPDDVSIAIPPAACPFNATIGAARIRNPQLPATESPCQVEFEPSGLVFAQPVTITIPYSTVGAGKIQAYWFDAATGTFRDEGITDVRSIRITRGLGALQFKTTRLASFYLVFGDSPATSQPSVRGAGSGAQR